MASRWCVSSFSISVILGLALALVTTRAEAQSAASEGCDDDALSALAAVHALDHVTPTELLARARRDGASYPSLHVITLSDDDLAGRARWMRTLASRGLGPLVCGEALLETSRVVVAAPAQGSLVIDGHALRVTLSPRFAEPVVYVRSRDAEPRAYAVREGIAQIDLGEVEVPAQLQLVATGPEGPRPVAELRVGEGEVVDSLPEDPTVITLLRARAESGPLRPNRLLAEVAEEHAERVCATGHVAHEIADEGNAEQRLRRAHVEARHVGEVVSRAADERGAWRALVASPSHRAALGDRRFTDVGVARVEHEGRTCLVVVLASWPRRAAR
ncbi:MAG: CAP domain-containing protein [Deltaproteobacteria bacterium]|nr:CAP domain-containing protein [Deltaproteobacteria bacterium]